MIENAAKMPPDQLSIITAFAAALIKLRDAHDRRQGAELTSDEVAGIIWGVKTLRGDDRNDPADAAQR